MKKGFFIALGLVAVVVGVSVTYWGEARLRLQAWRVIRLLDQGGENPASCLDMSSYARIFCWEGAFIARARAELKNREALLKSVIDNQLRVVQEKAPGLEGVWAVAFGIALAQEGRSLAEVPSDFRAYKQTLFHFVADGWAMIEVDRVGLSQVIDECRSVLGDALVPVCLFGIGRSTFFSNARDKAERLKAPFTQMGYDFARTFTNLNRQAENLLDVRAGVRAAEFFKALLADDLSEGSYASDMRCLVANHPVDCVLDRQKK